MNNIFDNIEEILKNYNNTNNNTITKVELYSQCNQDKFVVDILNKFSNFDNKLFLDFGCQYPIERNNTYYLENKYNYKGLSIDCDLNAINKWKLTNRNSHNVKCIDLTKINIEELLDNFYGENRIIDYFSFDLEPPLLTLDTLKKIPLHKYKFKIVTFEHDGYRNFDTVIPSRKIFFENGYRRIKPEIANIYYTRVPGAEDWWIHPDLITIPEEFLEPNHFNLRYNYHQNKYI